MNKEGRIRRNPHPTMDGDRDKEPHWSTGPSTQGPNEEQKEGKHKQGSQDFVFFINHLLLFLYVYLLCSWRPEEGIESSENGVTDGSELQYGY